LDLRKIINAKQAQTHICKNIKEKLIDIQVHAVGLTLAAAAVVVVILVD
jgi:hypothetical protein